MIEIIKIINFLRFSCNITFQNYCIETKYGRSVHIEVRLKVRGHMSVLMVCIIC